MSKPEEWQGEEIELSYNKHRFQEADVREIKLKAINPTNTLFYPACNKPQCYFGKIDDNTCTKCHAKYDDLAGTCATLIDVLFSSVAVLFDTVNPPISPRGLIFSTPRKWEIF